MAFEQRAQHIGVVFGGVHECEQQRASLYHACVGDVEGGQIYYDVGSQCLGTLGDLNPAAGVGVVAVVDMLCGAALHLYPEASGHKHACSLGSEWKTMVKHAARGRQAYHCLTAHVGSFQYFF